MNASPRASSLATWALGLSVLFVIPLVPLIGAALGFVAWVRIRRSKGKLTGEGRALTAVAVGSLAGSLSLLALFSVVVPGRLGGGPRAQIGMTEGSLRDIERAVYRYHASRGRFPVGDTGWTPDDDCCADGARTCRLDPEDWRADPIWLALDFVPRTRPPMVLRYRSEDGRTFLVEARGDVECDGVMEGLEMRGDLSPSGGPRPRPIRPVPGGAAGAPGVESSPE